MGVGGGSSHDPNLAAWTDILDKINALFEDEDFDPNSVQTWVQGVVTILVQNEDLRNQASANTKEQFRESQTLEAAVTDAVLDHQDTQSIISEKFFENSHRRDKILTMLSDLVYLEVQSQSKQEQQNEADEES